MAPMAAIAPSLLLILCGKPSSAECAYLPLPQQQQRDKRLQRAPKCASHIPRYSAESATSEIHNTIRSICSDIFAQERKRTKQKSNLNDTNPPSPHRSFRSVQARTAGSLLRNMTRATQTRDMFRDPDALWGYARSKFYVRARLLADALGPLRGQDQVGEGWNRGVGSAVLPPLRDGGDGGVEGLVLDRLLRVRSACSIGCGPGNDAVGLVALLGSRVTSVSMRKDLQQPTVLDRMVFLDYAIDEWKSTILSPLVDSILIPGGYVRSVEMDYCDVKQSLFHCVSNSGAQKALGYICQVKDDREYHLHSPCDIYLISYLLSETRGHWEDFVTELVYASEKGTLFYFAEPSPEPLRRIKELCLNIGDKSDGGLDFIILRPNVWLAMKI